MKKKMILMILFLVSLSPMLLNQYGCCRGVQEITGLINLLNPIGIISLLLFPLGVWGSKKVLCILGMLGMIVSEIYEFLTWHIRTITGEMSIQDSFQLAFPEFYVGLFASILMLVAYFVVDKYVKN